MQVNKKVCGSVALVGFMFMGLNAYAGEMGAQTDVNSTGHVYAAVFGGGGTAQSSSLSVMGTAFFTEAIGGPLAVNAFGQSNTRSTGVIGAHVGYEWAEKTLGASQWHFSPATELEGYYLGKRTIAGNDVNNDTTRLVEHNFFTSYPTRTGVFLINGVMNIHHSNLEKVHPYVGIGLGTAIMSISGASSIQTSPIEPGINHYNSDANALTSGFAAQPKVGVSFNITKQSLVFVEYRFLYITPTDYTFGSTMYTDHAPTSPWNVKIGAQRYSLGTVGLQYDL